MAKSNVTYLSEALFAKKRLEENAKYQKLVGNAFSAATPKQGMRSKYAKPSKKYRIKNHPFGGKPISRHRFADELEIIVEGDFRGKLLPLDQIKSIGWRNKSFDDEIVVVLDDDQNVKACYVRPPPKVKLPPRTRQPQGIPEPARPVETPVDPAKITEPTKKVSSSLKRRRVL